MRKMEAVYAYVLTDECGGERTFIIADSLEKLRTTRNTAMNMGMASHCNVLCYRFNNREPIAEEHVLKDGFVLKRHVNPVTIVGVMPLTLGRARLGIGNAFHDYFDEYWDYESVDAAITAATLWNPETAKEPPNYVKE